MFLSHSMSVYKYFYDNHNNLFSVVLVGVHGDSHLQKMVLY